MHVPRACPGSSACAVIVPAILLGAREKEALEYIYLLSPEEEGLGYLKHPDTTMCMYEVPVRDVVCWETWNSSRGVIARLHLVHVVEVLCLYL